MTDIELLQYIQRILQTCPDRKAWLALSELREILARYVTPPRQMQMVRRAMDNLPEVKNTIRLAGSRALTERDLEIAALRGEERKKREIEMEDQGRC